MDDLQDDLDVRTPMNASATSQNPGGMMAPSNGLFGVGLKNRYQTISENFDMASFPAELTDFDSLDEPNPHTSCFSVKGADPTAMGDFVIKQMMVQYEGNPDYGPLFPGTTDRVEPRLVIGKNNGWVNSQNLPNEKRQVFDLTHLSNSLVIRINENKFGIYQDIGAPAEIWIRKNRTGLIFFKVYKLDAEHKRNEVFAGYCFRK